MKYIDPSGKIVDIQGWSTQQLDAILASGDFWIQGLVVETFISPEYQAYSNLRGIAPELTNMMEGSDYTFEKIKIDFGNDQSKAPMVSTNVHTDLRDKPIPVKFVSEGSEEAKDLGDNSGRSLGFSLLGIEWGKAIIRYEGASSLELGQRTREECYHFYEQTKQGINWYTDYGNDYIAMLAVYLDRETAYHAIPAERRAKDYAGIANELPNSPWTIGFSLDWLPE